MLSGGAGRPVRRNFEPVQGRTDLERGNVERGKLTCGRLAILGVPPAWYRRDRSMPASVPLFQDVLDRIKAVTRPVRLRRTSVDRLALLVTGLIAARHTGL